MGGRGHGGVGRKRWEEEVGDPTGGLDGCPLVEVVLWSTADDN